ncbi:hypothetical protein NE601_17360, partial [Erysipelatoclostridium ramosum]|nr:hypothetical protein [Thomasclavelia ramosa]
GHSALKGPVRDKLDEYQAAVEQRKKEKLDSDEVDADGDIDMGEDKENAPVEKVIKEHDEIEEQGDALQDVEESSEK